MVLAGGGSVPAGRRARLGGGLASALLLASISADAHERFVKHRLKVPLHDEFFLQGPGPMGINPDLARIAITVFGIVLAFLLLWYLREPIGEAIERRAVRRLGGTPQHAMHQFAAFLTD